MTDVNVEHYAHVLIFFFNQQLRDQINWHWTNQLRDRLDGLTDDEYFWEPVPDCWSVRPRGTGTTPMAAGAGAMTIDFAFPAPDPAPFTTIAWRLGQIGRAAGRERVEIS
ncbi:DinB family protein, partial [Mycobacterium tuberculosis]|nr:DinB family protein [Mycobacterium tuberculosis]